MRNIIQFPFRPSDKEPDWVQTPFLTVPAQYVRTTDRSKKSWSRHMGVFITYGELYADTDHADNSQTVFRNELREFDFNSLMQNWAILNYLLKDGYGTRHHRDELNFVEAVFPDPPKQRLVGFWTEGRKIFFRQQLLSLLRANIVLNDTRKHKMAPSDDLAAYCRLFFRIVDFLDIDMHRGLENAKSEDGKNDILRGAIARNYSINLSQRFGFVFSRYWALYFECAKEAKKTHAKEFISIPREFRNATGLDLKLYLFLIFGVWGFYFKVDRSRVISHPELFLIGKGYFRNLRRGYRGQAKRIFQYLALSKSAFKRDFLSSDRSRDIAYTNFMPIWRRPLYKINNDAYLLLDMQYLQDKVSFGIYGELNDYIFRMLRSSKSIRLRTDLRKKQNSLTAFTGRCLEIYVKNLLKRIYPKSPLLAKQLISELEGDYPDGADFIISSGSALIVLEVTISGLKHETLLEADIGNINKEIQDRILFKGGTRSKGKVYQLDSTIKAIRNGKFAHLGVSYDRRNKLFPVLVLQKLLPYIPGKDIEYRKWIRDKGLLIDCIDNFLIIDVEDLEMVEALIDSGSSFGDLLEGYLKSQYSDQPFKHYLLYDKDAGKRNNIFLESQADKMSSAMHKYFKTTPSR